jgi:hypothetical protein
MEKKVVSLKEVKYTKMYETFYKDVNNQELSKHVFFRCDQRIEKAKTSKIS